MKSQEIRINTPRWALPLLQPARYKGAYGGRASGKSHFFAEYVVEQSVCDPDLKSVCIREIQKSLKFSSKSLIEHKIQKLGVDDLFEILSTEIRRKDGNGIILFQGLQDHTADSIKSLDGFGLAWVEEAQRLSARSLQLLRPTIRMPGSSILFSWNPEQPSDPVDRFLRSEDTRPEDSIVVQVNYPDNPYLPQEMIEEMEIDRRRDTDYYLHVWLGHYNNKSDAQILAGKWIIDDFKPLPGEGWDGPYFGADFGFANDPTTLIKCWIFDSRLYIEYESYAHHLELDDTAARWLQDIPGCDRYVIKADCARPESISYLSRNGMPGIESTPKWKGSVEDGIAFLRAFDRIVIHSRCPKTAEEARLYCYKVDRLSDEILPVPASGWEHLWDSARYALSPLIQQTTVGSPEFLTTGKRRMSSGASWR